MARYGSEAYDLSLFESKKAKVTNISDKREQKATVRRSKLQRLLNASGAILVFCGVLAVVAVLITSQSRLTELNNAIAQAEIVISEQEGEIKRLESELAAQTSAQSVEDYAQSAGLQQMESGQIDYITVTVPEKPQETEQGLWALIWGAIQSWLY